MRRFIIAVAVSMLPSTLLAQQTPSPYRGQESREIKALSADEVRGLQEGAGMGLAKAAELNGVPGPRHVLDLATDLELGSGQRERVQAIYDQMSSAARELGARIVELERTLDHGFAGHAIDAAAVERLAGEIGELGGRLRAVHLVAHLRTAEVLSHEQIARYAELRGYEGHEAHGPGPGPGR